jgi:hypothetical protein
MMFNYEPVHINSFVPVAFTTFFRPLLFFVFPLSPLRGVRGKMVFPSKKIQLPRGEREKSSKFPKSFSAFLNKAPDLNKVRGEFHFFCQNSLSLIPLFLIRLTLRKSEFSGACNKLLGNNATIMQQCTHQNTSTFSPEYSVLIHHSLL